MEVLDANFDIPEPFKGLGHLLGGRVEIRCAVLLRHDEEKKHSRVLSFIASNGMHPTFMPGIVKTAGGEGFMIVVRLRISVAQS